MSDAAVYVALRVEDLPEPHVESQRQRCTQCAAAVWVDPMSFVVIKAREPRLRVLCDHCVDPDSIRDAAIKAAPDMAETILRRDQVAKRICAERGWDKANLTLDQIFEIRDDPEWL